MSSGPKNVTSTTSSRPPAYLEGPLASAAQGASQAYRNGGFGQPGGIPLENLTNSGDRLIGESQNLVSDTLRGDYLNPDTNPYLQQTFNRAADLTQGRLDTQFSGAGRNLGASYPARSEELQTLASNIFGGNYQAERGRQDAAVTSAQGLDPLNMMINRLAGVIPGAGGVTTSTQPVFKQGLF